MDRCEAAGFSRYVSKPVDFRELSATIKDLLVLQSPGKCSEPPSSETTSQIATPIPLSRNPASYAGITDHRS